MHFLKITSIKNRMGKITKIVDNISSIHIKYNNTTNSRTYFSGYNYHEHNDKSHNKFNNNHFHRHHCCSYSNSNVVKKVLKLAYSIMTIIIIKRC